MKKNIYSGKFIVFEGLDGSGQSTQAALLKEFLEKEKKISVILTKEPTDKKPIGTLIRQILKREIAVEPLTLQLLFCADRSEHLKNVIEPALKNNQWVISDRYFFSTIAYGSLNLNFNWLIKLNENFLMPDIAFLLKVKPETCLKRIDKERGRREFFEELEKLKKVWKGYQILTKKFSNIRMIDGEKPIKEVLSKVKKEIRKFI